jgi:two-component system sensor histidine kinase KdpD
MRKMEYKGTIFEEMDLEAVKARNPGVILVDELAHTNIPGSKHRKRYEDVLELVDCKMEVLSTVNVQHLESIAPTVTAITGIKIRETVPDWVLEHANEIVMVDLTPEALQNRMKRGEVYHTGKVDQALKNFFRRGNLIALRELALRQVAEQVDRSLETYMDQKEIQDSWVVRERIAVCFSSNPRAQYLIARASRMARRMDAELYAIYVDIGVDTSEQDKNSLQANIQFSESLGAKVVKLTGKDVSSATAEFVREKHVTQVIFGRSAVEGWRKYLYMTAIHRFLRDAPAVDVHIVTQEPD